MIRIFSMLLALSLFVKACDNNKDTEKKDKAQADSGVLAREKTDKVNKTMMDELEKLAPLSEDQLKQLLPETLMEATLSNYSYNDAQGTAMVRGEYKINDSAGLSLNISDCAGAGGAGLYTLRFAGNLEYTIDNTTEYTKVIDFNGGKAIVHCMKTVPECLFTFFSGGRFLVEVEGNNLSADQLKQVAKDLKIK